MTAIALMICRFALTALSYHGYPREALAGPMTDQPFIAGA